MTVMEVAVIFLCLGLCVCSTTHDKSFETHYDIVECVIAIEIGSSILIPSEINPPSCISYNKSKQTHVLSNIGKIKVQVTSPLYNGIVEPDESRNIYLPVEISNFNIDNKYRALVHVSECNKNNDYFIENPDEDYDKNKILKGAYALGVRDIPENGGDLSTLITSFWPDDKENVWLEIYAVIKVLLDDNTQQIIYKILIEDIKNIEEEMIALNKLTQNNSDFDKKYKNIIEILEDIETLFILKDNEIFNLYIIPLYSNMVTMKMYFYTLGLTSHNMNSEMFSTTCQSVRNQYSSYVEYTKRIAKNSFDEIYNTVYAGGLYNVMMNARSHFARHTLELIPKWNEVYFKCEKVIMTDIYHPLPISYSNFYGRATPHLLELAIYVEDSILLPEYLDLQGTVVRLRKIFFYIKDSETVFCLKFVYYENIKKYAEKLIGTCKFNGIISYQVINLWEEKIIKLKAYKTTYIKCLEFTFLDNSTKIIGNKCDGNHSTNFEFQLEGHYIDSLYLAHDYPKTTIFFDNVAVSFLPN